MTQDRMLPTPANDKIFFAGVKLISTSCFRHAHLAYALAGQG